MKQCKMSLIIICGLVLFSAVAFANGVQVITGADTPVDTIDDSTIKKIFLGKTKSWPDGNHVEFVVLKSGDAHEAFLKQFIKKSPSQFKTYWKKQVFTGKGKNPTSFDTQEELAAYVAGNPGTIGYISTGADTAGVKVISEK